MLLHCRSRTILYYTIVSIVDLPRLKPYWLEVSNSFSSYITFRCISIIFSSIFPMESSIQSALYELGSSKGLLFILSSTSRVRFHTVGKIPCARHSLKTSTMHLAKFLPVASRLLRAPYSLVGRGPISSTQKP